MPAIEKSAKGPSWKKPGWPLIANGELVAALDGNWAATEIAVGNKIKGKAQAKGVELSEADHCHGERLLFWRRLRPAVCL